MWPFKSRRQKAKDDDALMKVRGGNQDAMLYPDRVVIRRWKGNNTLHYEKTIRMASLNAVQLRKPGMAGVGYLQFVIAGDLSPKGRGRLDTLADENTVVFNRKQYREFEGFRERVEREMFSAQ